jgi:hypothetical protein
MREHFRVGNYCVLQKIAAPGQWIDLYVAFHDAWHGFDPAPGSHGDRQHSTEQGPFGSDRFDKPRPGGNP